jgi:hypothetical protein
MTDVRIAEWVRRYGPKVQRAMPWVQVAVGLFLLALAWHMGHEQFELLRAGETTTGRIVRFEEVRSGSPGSRRYSAFHPVVEFEQAGRRRQFRDRIGSSSAAGVGDAVPIRFNPQDPSLAMIERPVWNWLPWAPTFLLGVFLIAVGVLGPRRPRIGSVA